MNRLGACNQGLSSNKRLETACAKKEKKKRKKRKKKIREKKTVLCRSERYLQSQQNRQKYINKIIYIIKNKYKSQRALPGLFHLRGGGEQDNVIMSMRTQTYTNLKLLQ